MKLKRLLSGVLAVAVAVSSMALSAFTTLAADDSDIVLPDSGAWQKTRSTNSAKLEFVPNVRATVSALSGKNEFYVTFSVTGVPDGGVRAYLPTVPVGGTAHWEPGDVVPFTEIPEDGTYTVKFSGETLPDPAILQYCAINCKKLTNTNDIAVGSIELVKVTLTDPNAATEVESFDITNTYTANGNTIVDPNSNVKATVYSDNSLVISGTGTTRLITSSSQPWASYPITSVTVEEGVTWLRGSIFEGMTNLESVSLPDSLNRLDNSCFADCTGLTDIVIPSGVNTFGSSAFSDCTSLKSVTILGPVTDVMSFAFHNCTALEEVTFANSDSLTEISTSAFCNCESLQSITIPDSVTSIGNSAFYNCRSLQSITIPDSVTSIGDSAFYYCRLLQSVTIPDSVTSIGSSAFSFCDLSSIIIPDSVTTISSYAFSYNKNLETATITEGLTEIPMGCFSNCTSLKNVIFPDSVTMSIGKYAFFGDSALESMTLPNGVTSIGPGAFFDCSSLKSVTIPDSVTSIGQTAFLGADALETCELSSSSQLESIGDNAFTSTPLKSIMLPSGTKIGRYAFKGCSSLESVTFSENGLKNNGSIGEWAFRECTSLTSIDIPEGVTSIDKAAFYSCEYLNSVTLPSTLTTIGDYAFMNTIRLNTITIPDSVTSLGVGAFECVGLNGDIVIPESITKLPNYAFKYCLYPTLNIHIKGEITEVGTDPFSECTGKIYVYDKNTYNLIKATNYGTAELIYALAPDTTDLDAAIAEAEAIDTDIYTPDSVKVLTDAVAAGKAVKANIDSTEEDVAKAEKEIRDAINALVAGDVAEIKAELESLVDKIEKLLTVKDESDYTADSWTALNEALTPAEEALASEEELTYGGYKALYEALNGAYTGLTVASKSNSDYVGTICGGYEVTYNHETDSYKVVVSDDVDMDSVVGTTYVKVTLTPNKDLSSQIPYGTLHIWNFLDSDQTYTNLKGSADNVLTYNLSIPSADSAFSLTAGTGWKSSDEVFYVKNVEFYNANDELLYTYSAGSIGVGDVRNLTNAIEKAEAVDKSVCSEESAAVLAAVLEDAKAVLNNSSSTKADYQVRTSELEAAIAALEYLPADYTAVEAAKAKVPADLSVYTDETAKAVTDAVAAVVEGKNITEQSEVDAWAKAIEDAIAGLELKPIGGTITGTINVSDKDNGTEMTVTAVAADGTEVSVTASSMGTYKLENLAVGDYTLTISGGKYAPRSYEITVEEGSIAQDVNLNPYGDINGDGKVTTADVGLANSHAKGVKTLTDYDFVCGDVNRDGGITTADVGMINSHAKGVKALW